MPPPFPSIPQPMAFDDWAQLPDPFFSADVEATTTAIINDAAFTERLAYGRSAGKLSGYWFYVTLASAREEEDFVARYETWRLRATGDHLLVIAGLTDKPPDCGTPTTPLCPPDDILRGRRDFLRDLLAGPGADAADLAAAERRVDDLLATLLDALIEPVLDRYR
jgi:hypothetical protein